MNRQHEVEPYWQDEDDWLCTVEFLPSNDPDARVFGADIIGYLLGYAQLTNARALALLGILRLAHTSSFLPFRRLLRKTSSWIWFARMKTWEATTSRIISCRRRLKRFETARPLVAVLPEDIVSRATLLATVLCAGTEVGSLG